MQLVYSYILDIFGSLGTLRSVCISPTIILYIPHNYSIYSPQVQRYIHYVSGSPGTPGPAPTPNPVARLPFNTAGFNSM